MKHHIEALKNLSKNYSAAERVARGYKDDFLSPAGLAAERAERTKKARALHKEQLDRARYQLEQEKALLQKRYTQAMPAPSGSTADAWARAKMLLDSGRALGDVVKVADVSMLQAIKEWGPAYLESTRRVQSGFDLVGQEPVDTSGLERSIARRWAEVDPAAAEPIREWLEAGPAVAKAEYTAGYLEKVLSGQSVAETALDAAINAEYAAQNAATDLGSGAEASSVQ